MKIRLLVLICGGAMALGMGPADAGPCTTAIGNLTKVLGAKDAGSGPTSGSSGQANAPAPKPGQHPPTAAMNTVTEGKAASAQDVRRQNQGRPTAAEQDATGAVSTADLSEASAALERARALDKQGKEAECMAAIKKARQLAGTP